MKKKHIGIFIFLMIVILTIGIVRFIFSLTSGSFLEETSTEFVVENQSFTSINVKTSNATIEIIPTKDSKATVEYAGRFKKKSDHTFSAKVKGDTLDISLKEKRFGFINFGISSLGVKVTVHIPEKEYKLVQAVSSNGRIHVGEIVADDIRLETSNGTVSATNTIVTSLNLKTSNGKVVLEEVEGEVTAKTSNGSISLIAKQLIHSTTLKTSNGRIEVQTENEPTNAIIKAKTGNGKLDIYGVSNELTTFGNGEHVIDLKTSNGRITVIKGIDNQSH